MSSILWSMTESRVTWEFLKHTPRQTENSNNVNFCHADTLHLNKPHLTLAHHSLTTGSQSAAQQKKKMA